MCCPLPADVGRKAAGTPDAAGNLYASRPQDGGPARLTGSQRYEELPPKQRLMVCVCPSPMFVIIHRSQIASLSFALMCWSPKLHCS